MLTSKIHSPGDGFIEFGSQLFCSLKDLDSLSIRNSIELRRRYFFEVVNESFLNPLIKELKVILIVLKAVLDAEL
jgi:hypothetical protein